MLGVVWWWLMLVAACTAEKWRFPEAPASVRIDNKIRYNDQSASQNREILKKSDHVLFREPAESQGFYDPDGNPKGRPNDLERLPDSEQLNNFKYPSQRYPEIKPVYEADGTLDSLQACKCSHTCPHRIPKMHGCGSNTHLCCHAEAAQEKSEYFHDLIDERPMLLPGRGPSGGPFPPPPDSALSNEYGPERVQQAPILSLGHRGPAPGIFTGKNDPNSVFGPTPFTKATSVLVGPEGPTGIIGPVPTRNPAYLTQRPINPLENAIGNDYNGRPVLVGPNGPTGTIGPDKLPASVALVEPTGLVAQHQRPSVYHNAKPVLVGPDGPTGTIGPHRRPVLVGSERPLNLLGQKPGLNDYHVRRPVLIGPDGPTGTIGPNKFPTQVGTKRPTAFMAQNPRLGGYYSGRPILTGPDGPTGLIGPRKASILVGPDRPTGIIGPALRREQKINARPILHGLDGSTATAKPQYEDILSFFKNQEEVSPSESAQRPVLVGPSGATGIIGPGYNQRAILVGPGGPTGIIGPRRPVLVGPGGPTGVVGPGYGLSSGPVNRRQVLVGPGGATGSIGPYGFYG